MVEIANVHAVVRHIAENMVGCRKRLGEYPTLSAIQPAQFDSLLYRRKYRPTFPQVQIALSSTGLWRNASFCHPSELG